MTEKPTRTGYTFLGWSDRKSDTTACYQPGDSYAVNADLTLYAIWEADTYTISYDMNNEKIGDKVEPETISQQVKEHGKAIYLSGKIPARSGYGFLGWATTKNATEAEYRAGVSFTLNKSVTLYAVWSTDKYSVSYNANDGSGAPDVQTKEYGTPVELSMGVPKRTGYTFMGWETESGVTYEPGAKYSADKNMVLYAVWKLITYSVTYDANGGNGEPLPQEKQYGTNVKLSADTPRRPGYDFLGWAESASATTAKYQPGSSYAEEKNLNLYAVWKEVIYCVTYDANGGSGAPSKQTKKYDVDITISKGVPQRTGYSFAGWSMRENATEAEYQSGDKYISEKSVTLYAVWKLKEFTVSYHANGGTNEPEAQTKYYGKELKLSSTKPVRDGYTFVGWAVSSAASKAQYQAGGSYEGNEKLELYAVWTTNQNSGNQSSAEKQIPQKISMSVTKSKKTVVYGGGSIYLNAKSSGGGQMSYQSTKEKVASISYDGKIEIKGYGETTIIVTANANGNYTEAEKRFILEVVPPKAVIKRAVGKFSFVKNSMGIEIKEVKKVTGYQIQICKNSKFNKNIFDKKLKKIKNLKYLIKKLKKKQYSVRVRAYKKVGKKTYYGAWSKVKRVKVH